VQGDLCSDDTGRVWAGSAIRSAGPPLSERWVRAVARVVTVDNFVRAETDMYFAMFVNRGALGRFIHRRELPVENTGVRPNRDDRSDRC
jgi:hypothetical protein